MVDDFIYLLQNDGSFRQLEVGEYEFTSLDLPGTNDLKGMNGNSVPADKYPEFFLTKLPAVLSSFQNIPNLWHHAAHEVCARLRYHCRKPQVPNVPLRESAPAT